LSLSDKECIENAINHCMAYLDYRVRLSYLNNTIIYKIIYDSLSDEYLFCNTESNVKYTKNELIDSIYGKAILSIIAKPSWFAYDECHGYVTFYINENI
jgi:uncharacterized protein YbcI